MFGLDLLTAPRLYLGRLERLLRVRPSRYSPAHLREIRKWNGVGRVHNKTTAAHINLMAARSACYLNPNRPLPIRVWKGRAA